LELEHRARVFLLPLVVDVVAPRELDQQTLLGRVEFLAPGDLRVFASVAEMLESNDGEGAACFF
jgi:hypothetical protein